MLEKLKKPAKHYATQLNIYVNHKMLEKGKDLAKRMAESGGIRRPFIGDALVRLHIQAEVEKADAILGKAPFN